MYFLLITAGIISTFIASYTDFKDKEVPDYLNFSLLAIAIGTRLIYSLITNYWGYFLYAIAFSAIAFAIGSALYYLRMWGGGDVKLITALSALFATFPNEQYFLLKFLIILLFTASLYGIIYSIIIAVREKNEFIIEFRKLLKKYRIIRMAIIITLIATIISLFFNIQQSKKILVIASSLLLTFYFYIYVIIKSVEKTSMIKTLPISELREEDWLAEDVIINNRILIKKTIAGITKEHLQKLKRNKIKSVRIKKGIPFVPPFFIAVLITFIYALF